MNSVRSVRSSDLVMRLVELSVIIQGVANCRISGKALQHNIGLVIENSKTGFKDKSDSVQYSHQFLSQFCVTVHAQLESNSQQTYIVI